MQNEFRQLIVDLAAVDSATRSRAAERMAQLGPDAKLAAVALVRATGDEAEEVRQWAASALEALGPPAVSDAARLANLVESGSDSVGYWAATLLGRLKAEAAIVVAELCRALEGTSGVSVRQRVAWALGEIGPSAAAALPSLERASNSPDPRLARLAQQAISQITQS